jgi:flotillin
MGDQLLVALQYSLIGLVAALVIFGVLYFAISRFMYIGRPNEVLIFSGRRHKERMDDGSVVQVGYRKIFGGRAWRMPILEDVQRIDLTTIPVKVSISNAYSRGGIPLTVQAIANVKVSSDRRIVGNAIERFLGRSRAEVQQVARETLEGHLRQVLAEMTPEEVNEERLVFAKKLQAEADDDLAKLGLDLDTLKIQHISDDTEYLDSIGRKQIAEILKRAEIAESDAEREAAQTEADSAGLAEVARQEASKAIAISQNEMRRVVADLEGQAKSEEERTSAAAHTARALAEQELQKVRSELEQKRLEADVVAPADAEKRAREVEAKGKAAFVGEEGKAQAAVLQMLNDAWGGAGHRAKEIYLIQQLEDIVGKVVEAVRKVQVANVNLLDNGEGTSLPAYVSSYPAIVTAVLKELREATGIDVPQVLTGNNKPPSGSAGGLGARR